MYVKAQNSNSQSENYLADIFFPKFLQKHIEKVQAEENNSVNSVKTRSTSISHCLCKHSSSCKICTATKSITPEKITEMIDVHKKVRDSGKFNFQECRIPVNERINVGYMRQLLSDYSDKLICDFLEFGFPLGFQGNENNLASHDQLWKYRNHKGATDFADEINSYLLKESKNNSILGPFKSNPFASNLVISPLNSVPKKDTTERRVILDLSFPKHNSINEFISKTEYLGDHVEVVFPKVDDFIELIKVKGQGCLLYKKDLRKAYRQLKIDPHDLNLVSFVWGKHIFCDTVVSMGLRSAAMMCQQFTNAISFIMWRFGIAILNYLDDLAGAEKKDNALFAYGCLGRVLEKCGIEESPEKSCPPSEIMVFLGVLFNTITMTVEVTPQRLTEIRSLIERWLEKDSATLKEIQSLLGKLNFVAACVRPSRIFVSRMLNWLRSIYHSSNIQHSIPDEVRKDLLWWHKFLPIYNGISLMEYDEWSVVFSSDSCLTGCGGFWNGNYFHIQFPTSILQMKLHITALEILSVVLCLKLWGKFFKGQRILVLCDNQAVSQVICSGKSRSLFLQNALREICFLAAVNEFQLKGQFIQGSSNIFSDILSRWHLHSDSEERFLELTSDYVLHEHKVESDMFNFINDW